MIADRATRVENDNLAVWKSVCPPMRYGCLSDFNGIVVPDESWIMSKMCLSAQIVSIIYWLQDTPVIANPQLVAKMEGVGVKSGFFGKVAAGQTRCEAARGEWKDQHGVTGT